MPSPSNTVVSEETFGLADDPGASADYSRGDHTHGSPPHPVPGFASDIIDAGDVTLNFGAVSWTLLTIANGATADFLLPLPAVAGDLVELAIPSLMCQSGNGFLDLATVVAGAAQRYASTGTGTPAVEGLPGLYKDPSVYRTAAGPWRFIVGAGDLSGGSVTFGLASRGTTGTLFASASYPFQWNAINYGQ